MGKSQKFEKISKIWQSVLYGVLDAVFLIENAKHSEIKQRMKKSPSASKCGKVTMYFTKQMSAKWMFVFEIVIVNIGETIA